MVETTALLIVIGILTSVFVFGLKTGIGCGFSKIKWPIVILLSLVYIGLGTIAGYFMDTIEVTTFMSSSYAVAIHITLALLLLFGGIQTIKKWNAGCDISKRTFLILAFPCPVCMSALFLSCVSLSTVVETAGPYLGFLVGLVFAFSIIISTFVMRNISKISRLLHIRFDGTPDALGSLMIFIGLFYLIAAIIIPAYSKAGAIRSTTSASLGSAELFILMGAFTIILLGAFLTKITERKDVAIQK
ncbi:MAG: DUF2162 domain-containing protein [Methanimicrococcus sp.]|nr:DUF2162 domain-containing protein [Methanimicrococcus sp.]